MISIVIPTYEQNGVGSKYLNELLYSIKVQHTTHKFEVCISDNCDDDSIWNTVKEYTSQFPIHYKKHPIKGAPENINSAIGMAHYDFVKLMCMDDLFADRNAINIFVEALHERGWAFTNSLHINEWGYVAFRKKAEYNHNQFEKNITGMPSVIGWRKCDLRFDVRLRTFCDMYFYYQLYDLYGEPYHIKKFTISQRFHYNSYSKLGSHDHDKDRNFLRENNMIRC